MVSCIWLLSLSIVSLGSISIVACIKSSFLFLAELHSSCFHLLATSLEQCYCEYSHTNFDTNMSLCLWGRPRRNTTELHGSLVHVCLLPEEQPDGFSQWQNHSHTQPAPNSGARFPDFHICIPASSYQPLLVLLWLRITIELWFLFVSFILNDTEQTALYLQTT